MAMVVCHRLKCGFCLVPFRAAKSTLDQLTRNPRRNEIIDVPSGQKELSTVKMRVRMTKLAIAIAALAVLAVLVPAVFRARASRELILETNGRPLANLNGSIMPARVAESPVIPTSTDGCGSLDLRSVPRGAEQINLELSDDAGNVRFRNTLIELPTGGFRTVLDFRGNRTIRTTTKTYADFVLFKFTVQEAVTSEDRGAK
jgi:hypothetical protein